MDNNNIISLLKEHEEGIARLYQEYAKRFIKYEQFWNSLAGEESIHISWLYTLQQEVAAGRAYVDEGKVRVAAVQYSINFIKKECERVQSQEYTLINALAVAFSCEDSMIEKGFFKFFESDSQKIKEIFQELQIDTEAHKKRIKELMPEGKNIS